MEKMARVYDDEILPIWSQRFAKMMLRDLNVPSKAVVLDVGCATGYVSLEILKRMDDQGRIIALDPIAPLLNEARKKAGKLSGKRIFFRSEPPSAKLAFADEVYHLVFSNLGLLHLDNPAEAIKEFARVTKGGGTVFFTLPLNGTYSEFFDIYREVLTKNDAHEILARLEDHIAKMPDVEEVLGWMEHANLKDCEVDVQKFSLLFKSSREFFFAPVVEFGPLSAWKEVAGKGQKMQEIFWNIKEAIDAYFSNRAFEVTIKAGCFHGTKPETDLTYDILKDSVSAEELLKPSTPRAVAQESSKAPPPEPEHSIPQDFLLDEEEDSS